MYFIFLGCLPVSHLVPDSLYKLGVIEKILLNEETSLSHFSRLIKEYPDTGAAELAKKSIETSTQE